MKSKTRWGDLFNELHAIATGERDFNGTPERYENVLKGLKAINAGLDARKKGENDLSAFYLNAGVGFLRRKSPQA